MGKSRPSKSKSKDREDKERNLQAKQYILDPLTAPEPSQLDGPGSSFFNPRRSLSLNYKQDIPSHVQQLRNVLRKNSITASTQIHQSLPPSAQQPSHRARSQSVTAATHTNQLEVSSWQQKIAAQPNEPNRTNDTTSHKKGSVRPKNPKDLPKSRQLDKSDSGSTEDNKKSKGPTPVPAPSSAPQTVPSAPSPASIPVDTKPSTPTTRSRPSRKTKQTPPLSSHNDSRLRNPILSIAQTHHNTAGILSNNFADRTNHHVNRPKSPPPSFVSSSTTKPTLRHTGSFKPKTSYEMASVGQIKMVSPHVTGASFQTAPSRPPTYTSRAPSRASSAAGSTHTARAPSVAGPAASSRASSVASSRAPSVAGSAAPGTSSGSKSERHSSSHRKHRAPKPGRPFADIIDRLDETGPAYHHGGPYDATLASVNANKKKAPLEAVKESNMEALKATPLEYINDSLTKHVPLQGTAMVPPGMTDWNGRVMDYKEGADLMREPDAAGGAYKRYDFYDYHPDDLKGKGQSYLMEKEEKENKAKLRKQQGSKFKPGRHGSSSYELQDQRHRRSQDDSAPLLSPTGDHLQTPVRMHRHSSAGASSQQSRHADSRRSERNRSHSHGYQGASAVPRTSSISGNVSPLSSTHSIRRKDVGSPTASTPRSELQGASRSPYPMELSPESIARYRSELQADDTDYGRPRSNSAGQRIADGIKRHLGTLRRK